MGHLIILNLGLYIHERPKKQVRTASIVFVKQQLNLPLLLFH